MGSDANKNAAPEQRQLQVHPAAVLPQALRAIERQERLDLSQSEMLSNSFFVARSRVDRKPLRDDIEFRVGGSGDWHVSLITQSCSFGQSFAIVT